MQATLWGFSCGDVVNWRQGHNKWIVVQNCSNLCTGVISLLNFLPLELICMSKARWLIVWNFKNKTLTLSYLFIDHNSLISVDRRHRPRKNSQEPLQKSTIKNQKYPPKWLPKDSKDQLWLSKRHHVPPRIHKLFQEISKGVYKDTP